MSLHNADRMTPSALFRVFGMTKSVPDGEPDSGNPDDAVERKNFSETAEAMHPGLIPAPADPQSTDVRDLFSRAFEFRLSELLRLRTFLYLLPITAIFLLQTHNTIAIKNLAIANEALRQQIAMSSSVITSQELKVNELQSIHNIAGQAGQLGLHASNVPAVEIVP